MSSPAQLATETWSRAAGAVLDTAWSRETFAWALAEAARRGLFWGACEADRIALQRAEERAERRRVLGGYDAHLEGVA